MDKTSKALLAKMLWKVRIKALQSGNLCPGCFTIEIDKLREEHRMLKDNPCLLD